MTEMPEGNGADPWTNRLSDYLDDELTPGERGGLEQHLDECLECRATLAELREVIERARTLGDRPPSVDLWPGVAARLGALTAGLPSAGPPALGKIAPFPGAPPLFSRPRRFSFSALELVAAGVMLMLLSGGAAWWIQSQSVKTAPPSGASAAGGGIDPSPGGASSARVTLANFADAQFDAAVGDLQRALAEGRDRLDPRTIAVLERNLGVIDQAIRQAREALASDPANTYLNTHLAEARRRKLQLLRDAAALASRST